MLITEGNIFSSKAQTIVNTVNCVGVMGAGIAYECRLRYHEMYQQYVDLCSKGMIKVGSLWIYKSPDRWILNFPTKQHWRYPTKVVYLERGLEKFMQTYEDKGITSIAFPLLGASHGGLDEDLTISIMTGYLETCNADVEIYKFDPFATDDLYLDFRERWLNCDQRVIAGELGMRINFVKIITRSIQDEEEGSLSGLLRVKGIGKDTLEKAFNFIMQKENGSSLPGPQTQLDF